MLTRWDEWALATGKHELLWDLGKKTKRAVCSLVGMMLATDGTHTVECAGRL